VVTATVVLAALFLITDWFFYLPLAALAAMVEVAVFNLIDFEEMIAAYHLDKRDFMVMTTTFVCTLAIGVKEGLLIGIVFSMALVVQHSAFPRIVVLGKRKSESGANQYRDIKRFTDAEEIPGILIVRLDAKLFFANAARFGDFINKAVKKRTGDDGGTETIHTVLIDSRGINDVDLSGIHMLKELVENLHNSDLHLVFCNINDMVKKRMMKSGIDCPEEFIMADDTQEAVDFIHSEAYFTLCDQQAENGDEAASEEDSGNGNQASSEDGAEGGVEITVENAKGEITVHNDGDTPSRMCQPSRTC